jgi:hypothetical protein
LRAHRNSKSSGNVDETRGVSSAHQNAARSGNGRESRKRRNGYTGDETPAYRPMRTTRPHAETIERYRDSTAGPKQTLLLSADGGCESSGPPTPTRIGRIEQESRDRR